MMSDASPGSIASLLKEGVERSGVPTVIYGNIRDIDNAAGAVCRGDTIVGIPAQIIHLCRKYPWLRPESVLLSAGIDACARGTCDQKIVAMPCIYPLWNDGNVFRLCSSVPRKRQRSIWCARDSLLIEIVDPASGRQLDFGREGEVVVTAFANEAMPLFRYRTGIASLATGAV